MRIPLESTDYRENTEYFVELSATIKEGWGLLPAGFEVAHEQIELSCKHKNVATTVETGPALNVTEEGETTVIPKDGVRLIFGERAGRRASG
jgi:beta-galactosidase